MGRKLAWGLLVATLGVSSSAAALGLGAIDTSTSLNEPLSARIPLLSVAPEDAALIDVELASMEAFERAGVERLFSLTQLEFEVRTSEGQPYVHVTTKQPIKEPFLDFLLQVNWPQGRLVREYTVLLNPPLYGPETVPTAVASAAGDSGANRGEAPDAAAVTSAPAAAAPRSVSATGMDTAGSTYGPVRRGDTLWSIASQIRVGGRAEVNRTMLAILRANPDAFIDGNINALKRGAVLRIPSAEQIDSIGLAEATAEVRRQMARWQANRSEAADTATAGADTLEAGEPGTEATAEGGVTAQEQQATARLSVVAPENSAGSDATSALTSSELSPTAENVGRLQREMVTLEERNASLESANTDLRTQLESLKQELANLRRTINLRMEQALPLPGEEGSAPALEMPAATALGERDTAEDPISSNDTDTTGQEAGVDATPRTAAPAATQVPSQAAVEPAGEPAEEPAAPSTDAVAEPDATAQPQPTLVERLLNDSRLPLAAGGVALLLLLLLALLLRRRRSATVPVDESDAVSVSARGDDAETAVVETTGAADDGDTSGEAEDPLQQAEGHLAHGRYDQAQEVLDQALGEDPGNRALRARLLEVLAKQGDRGGFEAEAQVLRTQLEDESDPLWQRAVELGREIAPEHPLFSTDTDTLELGMAPTPASVSESAIEPMPATGGADGGDVDTAFSLTSEEAHADAADVDFTTEVAPADESDTGPAVFEFELPEPTRPASPEASAEGRGDTGEFDDDFALDFSLPDEADVVPAAEAGGYSASGDEFALDGPADADEYGEGEDSEFGALEFEIPAEDISSEPLPDRRLAGADDLQPDAFALDAGEGEDSGEPLDEVGTKLDLARAYLDMGDADGARDLLDEVIEEGSADQRNEAQRLLRDAG